MRLLLLSGLLFLGACHMGPGNLSVTVFPDGTGKAQAMRMTVPTAATERAPMFKGLARGETLVLHMYGGPFRKVDALEVGGITFALEPKDKGHALETTIPTTSKAAWYQALGLDAKETEAMRAFARRMRESGSGGEAGPMSINAPDEMKELETPSFVFEVTMPGPVLGNRIIGEGVPDSWALDPAAGKGSDSRKARLEIPLADILADRVATITWEVSCGPIGEDGQKDWDENKRELEKGKDR